MSRQPLLLLLFVATVYSDDTAYFNCALSPADGVQSIKLDSHSAPFNVLCDKRSYGGDWTVVMSRFDGSVPFHNQSWYDYKAGFGDLYGEFFIGLDKLHALTNSAKHEALFIVVPLSNKIFTTSYTVFRIADDTLKYELLEVGAYSGDGGNEFAYNSGYFCRDEYFCDLPGWNAGPIGYGISYIFGTYPESSAFDRLQHGHFELCWHRIQGCHLLSSLKWLIRPVNKYSILRWE